MNMVIMFFVFSFFLVWNITGYLTLQTYFESKCLGLAVFNGDEGDFREKDYVSIDIKF